MEPLLRIIVISVLTIIFYFGESHQRPQQQRYKRFHPQDDLDNEDFYLPLGRHSPKQTLALSRQAQSIESTPASATLPNDLSSSQKQESSSSNSGSTQTQNSSSSTDGPTPPQDTPSSSGAPQTQRSSDPTETTKSSDSLNIGDDDTTTEDFKQIEGIIDEDLPFRIPVFRGRSKLHSYCDYILYIILQLPIQQFTIGNNRTKNFIRTDEFDRVFFEATRRLQDTELKIQDLICNTDGYEVGFQTPMQCSNVTKRCECLIVNDLYTVQPLGVVGCLGDEGSYCIPGALECAFGYTCIDGKCGGTLKLTPTSKFILGVTLLSIVFHL